MVGFADPRPDCDEIVGIFLYDSANCTTLPAGPSPANGDFTLAKFCIDLPMDPARLFLNCYLLFLLSAFCSRRFFRFSSFFTREKRPSSVGRNESYQ